MRERGLLTIERAVQRLTADGARLFGLAGRGTVTPGGFADLNLLDWDALALPRPAFVHDFPHGAGRFVQRGEGYVATLVNGTVFLEGGEPAGPLSGRVLRSG